MIGQAIIGGLLFPAEGKLETTTTYNQVKGGYWQGAGGTHTQGEGDYHQAVNKE